jgi:hypothetical protein
VRTELTDGLADTRGVRRVTPELVADAIIDALERPRFDVFVPRSLGPLGAVVGLLPRTARDAVSRLFKVDRVLVEVDQQARAGYEARAAASAPAAEAVVAESSADRATAAA